MIGVPQAQPAASTASTFCGEPQCLCKQMRPAQMAPETDHEYRWALREAIRVMYGHLGLELKEEE